MDQRRDVVLGAREARSLGVRGDASAVPTLEKLASAGPAVGKVTVAFPKGS